VDALTQERALGAYRVGLKHLGHGRRESARLHLSRAASLAPGEPRIARSCSTAEIEPGQAPGAAVPVRPEELATPGRRTGALAVDLLIFFVLAGIASAILNAALPEAETSRDEDIESVVTAGTVLGLYLLYFWAGFAFGQTIGGRAAGCRVVEMWMLSRPGWGRGLVRAAASLLSWPLFFAGWLWAIWDPAHQTWHDKIAGTYVLDARRDT
jgi:uncharacterized RDD family membrane protein YckC